jgi:hypothetical protein
LPKANRRAQFRPPNQKCSGTSESRRQPANKRHSRVRVFEGWYNSPFLRELIKYYQMLTATSSLFAVRHDFVRKACNPFGSCVKSWPAAARTAEIGIAVPGGAGFSMKEVNSFRALLCVLAASLVFAATSAPAQTYPTRPVRVILPFAAGGMPPPTSPPSSTWLST